MARGSLRASIFTLMSAAIGPGALLVPYMFRLVGVPLGLFCLSVGAYTSAQSMRFIISIVYLTGEETYPAGISAVLGPAAGRALSFITTFVLVLATGCNLKSLAELLQGILGPGLCSSGAARVLALAAVLPTSVRPDASVLRHVAVVPPLALIYVIALILAHGLLTTQPAVSDAGARGAAAASATLDLLRFGDGGLRELPQAWSIVVNAMTCHHLAVPVYKELHCAKAQRVNKVVLRSVTSISLLLALVGASGFLTHGAATPENILFVYPPGDVAALLAQVLVASALLVATPLNVHALRGHLLETLPAATTAPLKRASTSLLGRCVLAGVLLGLPATICFTFPSVSAIVGVGCGFGLTAYMFVLPSAAICALRWGGACAGVQEGSRYKLFAASIAGSGGGESFHERLLSSPLSSPLLSPRLGGSLVSSPTRSHHDLASLDQSREPQPFQLPSAAEGSIEEETRVDGSHLIVMKLPTGLEEELQGSSYRGRSSSPPPRNLPMWSSEDVRSPSAARSPSPSPSDDGAAAAAAAAAPRWSSEFALALASLALGSALGFAAALLALARLGPAVAA